MYLHLSSLKPSELIHLLGRSFLYLMHVSVPQAQPQGWKKP
ncbi:Uncharacterised protein [Vibrio cholerae]|nr:Uncharacterised protein [Vibrio cholerae]